MTQRSHSVYFFKLSPMTAVVVKMQSARSLNLLHKTLSVVLDLSDLPQKNVIGS